MLFYHCALVLQPPVNRSNRKRRLKSVTIRMIKKYNTNTSKVPANNTRNSWRSASKLKTSTSVSNPSGIQLKYAVMRWYLWVLYERLCCLWTLLRIWARRLSVFSINEWYQSEIQCKQYRNWNLLYSRSAQYVDDRCVNEELTRWRECSDTWVPSSKDFSSMASLEGRTQTASWPMSDSGVRHPPYFESNIIDVA